MTHHIPLISVFFLCATLSVAHAQPAADLPVDAKARATVIDGTLAALTKYYVFPDVAAKISAAIRMHVTAKKYDKLSGGMAFAEALTSDLQAVSHDKHLRVHFSPTPLPDRQPDAKPTPEQLERFREVARFHNGRFVKVERLDGNIGYVRLDGFLPLRRVAGALARPSSVGYLGRLGLIPRWPRHTLDRAICGNAPSRRYFLAVCSKMSA